MRNTSDYTNLAEFDLRNFIRPGDEIQYMSMFRCENIDELTRHNSIRNTAKVVAVYEKFCYVQLRRTKECVNRWDILAVNGKAVNFGRG